MPSTRLFSAWNRLRTSYWFVPTLLSLAAAVTAVVMVKLDYAVEGSLPRDAWWLYGGNAGGARAVVATIIGSMITMTSVVFSITIVTLTLASGQFGSRLLRMFIRDRGNQLVLGVFIATFVYSLLVMLTVRGSTDQGFVPALSVTLAVALAIASVGMLIYFIHHVAVSIQADHVVASLAAEANEAIERLFPEDLGEPGTGAAPGRVETAPAGEAGAFAMRAAQEGYVEAIDTDLLMGLACAHDLLVSLDVRPGAFVSKTTRLLLAWPHQHVDEKIEGALRGTFVVGPHRTLTQDAEYGLRQLVEVAVRALSPGINDPFTAMSCLDRLEATLCNLARRTLPSGLRYDESGRLRIVAPTMSFQDFVDAALDLIRENAASSPAVLFRILDVVRRVADDAHTPGQRAVLREHARRVREVGQREFSSDRDRALLEERYRRMLAVAGTDAPARSA